MFCHYTQAISTVQSNILNTRTGSRFLGPLDINGHDYPKYDTGGFPTLSLILPHVLKFGNEWCHMLCSAHEWNLGKYSRTWTWQRDIQCLQGITAIHFRQKRVWTKSSENLYKVDKLPDNGNNLSNHLIRSVKEKAMRYKVTCISITWIIIRFQRQVTDNTILPLFLTVVIIRKIFNLKFCFTFISVKVRAYVQVFVLRNS
jgi:hypothetical protein